MYTIRNQVGSGLSHDSLYKIAYCLYFKIRLYNQKTLEIHILLKCVLREMYLRIFM